MAVALGGEIEKLVEKATEKIVHGYGMPNLLTGEVKIEGRKR